MAFAKQSYKPQVIYGEDNRKEVYEVEGALKKLASSTAALIEINDLIEHPSQAALYLESPTLSEYKKMCEEEPFLEQPTAAYCSGFLVADDILVTAGHCVSSQATCVRSVFVFDYGYVTKDKQHEDVRTLMEDNVYLCDKLLLTSASTFNITPLDYSIIQLDRPVVGRTPLSLRTEGSIEVDDEIFVIGHPTKLPQKIAGGAYVWDVEKIFFTANLDTYGGNSGSPVFNAKTMAVEGILVRGERDYTFHYERDCYTSNQCSSDPKESSCNGESVIKITALPDELNAIISQ